MLKLFVDNKHTDDHHWVDIVQKDDELIKKVVYLRIRAGRRVFNTRRLSDNPAITKLFTRNLPVRL